MSLCVPPKPTFCVCGHARRLPRKVCGTVATNGTTGLAACVFYHQRVLGSGSSLFFASPKNDIKAMTPMNDSKRAPLPSAEEEEDPQTNLKDASVTFPDMPTANCKWEEEACQRCIGGTTALTTRVLCSFFFDANSCIQQ